VSDAGRESEEPPLSEESSSEDNKDLLEKQVEDEIVRAELFQNQMAVADADLAQEQEQEMKELEKMLLKRLAQPQELKPLKYLRNLSQQFNPVMVCARSCSF